MNKLTDFLQIQLEIDKAKGIVCKHMVRSWRDRHEAGRIEDPEEREFYRRIVADRKPYFMRYIYPQLMKEYNTYIKNTDRNAMREFQMTVHELEERELEEKIGRTEVLTEKQRDFLRFYRKRMPVGMGPCVMNKICYRFEEAFDGYVGRKNAKTSFDYRIMKSDAEYAVRQFNDIRKLFEDYNRKVSNYLVYADYERLDEYETYETVSEMDEEFRKECILICPNRKALCNIVLDLCYRRNSTKRFAWSMCGEDIIQNLLDKNNRTIRYPVPCENGEFEYGGKRFTIEEKELAGEDDDCIE